MKNKNDLIYDLIFSDQSIFSIDIGEYIKDIHKYDEFIDEIKQILLKSKVTIINNSVDINSKTAMWKIKVKK
jgi:protein associated with RNAse G/E